MAVEAPDFETIDWDFDEATGIGTITLDRPEKMNALSRRMYEEISEALEVFEALDRDSLYEQRDGVAVRALIFEGAGDRAFCAGADVEDFADEVPGVFNFTEMYNDVESFPAPTIAKIDGYALGGGFELALTCDFRLASERSEVGLPEIQLGIIPGDGATQRLPELVGPSRTKELAMTAAHVEAPQAESEGMLDHVYHAENLDEEVQAFVDRIVSQPPLAVRTVKEVVNMSQETSLRVGRYYERRAGSSLTQTDDHAEGVAAFQEDREPEFEGK